MLSKSNLLWGLVVVIQAFLCCHLYVTQLALLHKMDQLSLQHAGTAVLVHERSRREVQTADNSEKVVLIETADAEEQHASTTTPNRRKHNKKSHRRLPVEKYVMSTESTTAGPVIVRVSRTQTTQHNRRQIPSHSGRSPAALREHVTEVSGEFASLPPAAIHFVSDASNYTRERHAHYAGNGRIKISGIYKDWTPAHWTRTLGTNQHFTMDNGKLTVRQEGLYLFYAQIHYANVQEVNCYRCLHNGQVVAQCCSTTAHPDRHEIKANTCSLLTTLYLNPHDTLWLVDLHERYVILTPEKSYFGLIQMFSH